MKPTLILTAASVFGLAATMAAAADFTVERDLHLALPSTEAWNVIDDFCDIDDWHPGISACVLKVVDGRLHRVLTTTEGDEIVEALIASEFGTSYTYKVVTSPLPLDRFVATIAVEPGNGAHMTWSVRFTSQDSKAEADVTSFIEAGLSAIEAEFASD